MLYPPGNALYFPGNVVEKKDSPGKTRTDGNPSPSRVFSSVFPEKIADSYEPNPNQDKALTEDAW